MQRVAGSEQWQALRFAALMAGYGLWGVRGLEPITRQTLNDLLTEYKF